MFILDELYKNNMDYPINENYINKFLFYRSQDDDIDVDVCKINIENYKLLNPLISQEAIVNEQKNYNKSHEKYELIDNGQVYRGETIFNCMQILLQIVNYDNHDTLITSNDFDEIKQGIKESSVLSGNPNLEKLLNLFVEKCYCEGNFFAIPYIEGFSLNQAKGKLKKRGYQYTLVDSSDTYFKVCYAYFVNGENGCQVTRWINEKYDVWKKRYLGRENWGLFVKDHMLEDFMDSDGKPLSIWNKTRDGFAMDLENYLQNAIRILMEREKKIYERKRGYK